MIQVVPPPTKAMSLVEIMVAIAVAAVTLFPLATNHVMNIGALESGETETEAITLASNIMDFIISPTLPFGVIDCEWGQSQGLNMAYGNIPQAGFMGASAMEWERKIADKIEDVSYPGFGTFKERIKYSQKRVPYKVYFFAGIYWDQTNVPPVVGKDYQTGTPPENIPNPQAELTFNCLPGPYGERAASEYWKIDRDLVDRSDGNEVSDRIVLIPRPTDGCSFKDRNQIGSPIIPGFSIVPYLQGPSERDNREWKSKLPSDSWLYKDAKNYFRIPGWPVPPSSLACRYAVRSSGSDKRPELRAEIYGVAKRTANVTWGFHPKTSDQAAFAGPSPTNVGTLMKVVVGVKYKVQNFTGAQGGVKTAEREFWLVSLKGRLE